MKNKFLLISLIILVIVSISFGVYMGILYNGEKNNNFIEKERLNLSKKEKCAESGQKRHEYEVILDVEGRLFNAVSVEPKYFFNESFDTCIYVGGYNSDIGYRREIIDLYTNNILYFSQYNGDVNVDGLDIDTFHDMVTRLINNLSILK